MQAQSMKKVQFCLKMQCCNIQDRQSLTKNPWSDQSIIFKLTLLGPCKFQSDEI